MIVGDGANVRLVGVHPNATELVPSPTLWFLTKMWYQPHRTKGNVMETLNRTYPKYQPTLTGVGCATHGAADCLCDVMIGAVVPIIPGPHMFHQHVLDVLDDDVVSARNIYDYMVLRLGMFESFTRLAQCGWCGQEMVKNHSTHTTCSSKCRMAQSRANRKGVAQ